MNKHSSTRFAVGWVASSLCASGLTESVLGPSAAPGPGMVGGNWPVPLRLQGARDQVAIPEDVVHAVADVCLSSLAGGLSYWHLLAQHLDNELRKRFLPSLTFDLARLWVQPIGTEHWWPLASAVLQHLAPYVGEDEVAARGVLLFASYVMPSWSGIRERTLEDDDVRTFQKWRLEGRAAPIRIETLVPRQHASTEIRIDGPDGRTVRVARNVISAPGPEVFVDVGGERWVLGVFSSQELAAVAAVLLCEAEHLAAIRVEPLHGD